MTCVIPTPLTCVVTGGLETEIILMTRVMHMEQVTHCHAANGFQWLSSNDGPKGPRVHRQQCKFLIAQNTKVGNN